MAYRLFFGACISTIVLSACSSDETAPAVQPSDSGAGGSVTSTGGRSSGGASNTGGASTGGRNAGGTSGNGGASTGGAGAGNGGAGGTATGGADAGPGNGGASGAGGTATGGASGAGGANTGGATADAGACGALSACCNRLTGGQRTVCENVVNTGSSANCTAVSDVFCGDGGVVGPPGPGSDAFIDCNALAACCAALADGGRAARQCDRVVTNNNNDACNQVSVLFCN